MEVLMNRTDLRKNVGLFGHITGKVNGLGKSLYGNILYVDVIGVVVFIDNDGYSYRFRPEDIEDFVPCEFKDKSK